MTSINIELTKEELEELKKFKKGNWKDFLYQGLWLKGCLLREPRKDFDISWKTDKERIKPCHKLGFCPYGQIIEEFPIDFFKKRTEFSCKVFGHNCPVFYCAEPLSEE